MSFDPKDSPLLHILEAIENIRIFTNGLTFEQYEADLLKRSAVERMFQILTEAGIRLGRGAEDLVPGIDWRGLRSMGNFLRHEYERVEDRVIWDAIQIDLPVLEKAVRKALTTGSPQQVPPLQ